MALLPTLVQQSKPVAVTPPTLTRPAPPETPARARRPAMPTEPVRRQLSSDDSSPPADHPLGPAPLAAICKRFELAVATIAQAAPNSAAVIRARPYDFSLLSVETVAKTTLGTRRTEAEKLVEEANAFHVLRSWSS